LLHDARDALGQRDVAHLGAHLLTVGEAELDELAQRRRLLGILVVLVEEQPGVGRDRVGLAVRRVGDPAAQVRGKLHAGQGGPPPPPGAPNCPALFWTRAISTLANLAKAYSM